MGCKQCPDTTWCRIPPHAATHTCHSKHPIQNVHQTYSGTRKTESLGGLQAEEHVRMRRKGMVGEMLSRFVDVKLLLFDEVHNRQALNTFPQHQAQPHREKARAICVSAIFAQHVQSLATRATICFENILQQTPRYELIGTHAASCCHASESGVVARGKSFLSHLFWSGNASDASSTTRARLGFNHDNERSNGTCTVAVPGFNWTNLHFLKLPDEH